MFIQNYHVDGLWNTTCGWVDYSDFTIDYPTSLNQKPYYVGGAYDSTLEMLQFTMETDDGASSIRNLDNENLLGYCNDLNLSDGHYILWSVLLDNGYRVGCTITVFNGGRAYSNYNLIYGHSRDFDSLTSYLKSNGELTDSGKQKFNYSSFTTGGDISLLKNMKCCYFSGYYKKKYYSGLAFFTYVANGYPGFYERFSCVMLDSSWDKLGRMIVEEFDDEYGEASTSGGYGGGSFDNSSDAFGEPQLPSVGVTTTGFINVYNPSINMLKGFAEDLFPDIAQPVYDDSGTLEAVANNLKAVGETMKSFADCFINQNLIQYVIDCHIVPCAPQVSGNDKIKVGFKTFFYTPSIVSSDYVTVNCGKLNIKEYYKNFLDYVGTKAKLYLPFVGFVDLKNEWFQDGTLEVIYHYNVIDGSFMAFVLATSSKSKLSNTVVGSYGGNACVHIPITGTSYSSMISGVVSGISKAVTSAKSTNLGGLLEGGANLLSAKPSVEQSNSYNSNSAFMGIRKPYLIIERPVASFSKNYPSEQGLPLNVTKKLNSVSGFTVCENLHTEGIDCTKEEQTMIASLFKSGVIL